ncbi:hypothetical protein TorRG33x02_293550 [Trema orientale]|uniref:Uncharacterized protein n=1 Tax=Trema orientale TaxID=63057 RepID=A0A2P5C902_TREOI|nr:hypothetical protein TorRG33x02_293550 [Trema orientale]
MVPRLLRGKRAPPCRGFLPSLFKSQKPSDEYCSPSALLARGRRTDLLSLIANDIATSSRKGVEVVTSHDDFKHPLAKSISIAGKSEVPNLLALVFNRLSALIKLQ